MTVHVKRERKAERHGRDVELFTLVSREGVRLELTNYGATLVALHTTDREGRQADIVLGFDRVTDYFEPHPYFGSIVGRVANRIAGSEFSLDGARYELPQNEPPDHLHGGPHGFDKVVWDAETASGAHRSGVVFRYSSADGEAGYPGRLDAQVTYWLATGPELQIEMQARTDRPTLVNLAQHAYYNLAGVGAGDVLDHELLLFASHYTPGSPVIPNGSVEPVAGTPFDFTRPKLIGRDLTACGGEPVGFDHNFVVDGSPKSLRPVARLAHPPSGRVLSLFSDQPGVQLYTGNFLDGSWAGKGTRYEKHAGLCLETQAFPNAIGVPAWRDQVLLRPEQTYRHTLSIRLGVA